MKKILTAAVLFTLCITPAFAKKAKEQPKTFDQVYEAEVTAANVALRDFANTPCTASEFEEAKANLILELKAFDTMYRNIPETEDDLLQARQIELYIGLTDLMTTVVEKQVACENPQEPVNNNAKN